MSDANTATERPIPWLIGVAALLWLTFNCTHSQEMAPMAKPAPAAVAPAVAPQPAPATAPTLAAEPAPAVEAPPAAATPTAKSP